MEVLQKQLNKIRIPSNTQSIYKDECVYSYDTPETATGLYVNLTTFLGFGEDFIDGYYNKTGNGVFLHLRREKKKIEEPAEQTENGAQTNESGPERKITRLAIGVEGGFADAEGRAKYEYKDIYSIVILPGRVRIDYPDQELPLIVQQSAEAIISSESAISKLEKLSVAGTWDGEARTISKFANDLKQLDNGKKIPPSGWKCEMCDLTNNLWLNLTDGSVLCGRKFFDGSGGNDHAVHHYKETGHPLAVKLGTITADGKGDVFSYAEDDMVLDPKLEEHLAHFGIKIGNMQKSEKSMVELEIDINQRIGEWSILTESESQLVPLAGPGYTGMRNLGNSCYMNSVMQIIFTIPDFIAKFVNGSSEYFNSYPDDPANDFNIQMSKLGTGLWSGKYSSIAENSLDSETTGISPAMFKNLIGKNHPDFSTKQQQDALEFFLYLINLLERNSRGQTNPSVAFKFSVEDRVECGSSKKVKYTTRDEYCLPLAIDLNMATNLEEVKAYQEKANASGKPASGDNVVRPRIPLKACVERFAQTEVIDQFYSTAIKDKTTAQQYTRLATMPDYLLLHLKKFTLREDWVPVKLDVAIDGVDELDLTELRASGLQPGEELLPEIDGNAPPPPVMDETVLSELIAMGFPPEACKKAIFFTKNTGLDPATQWMMEHIADSDLGDPFVPPGLSGKTTRSTFVPNAESLSMLTSMGFDEHQATKALKATDNDIGRATDWIFSHQDELDAMDTSDDATTAQKQYRDGSGKYKLVAFVSHMGTSTQVGHYVCHIRKDDQWVIFNDSKVAVSQNPPKDLGYLYLYKRED